MDVVYGPYWWEGPDFKVRHQIFKPTGNQAEGSWKPDNDYSHDAFFAFVYDFNRRRVSGLPRLRLPRRVRQGLHQPGQGGAGEGRAVEDATMVFDVVDNESPQFADFDGDGKPDGIFHTSDPKIIPPRMEDVKDPRRQDQEEGQPGRWAGRRSTGPTRIRSGRSTRSRPSRRLAAVHPRLWHGRRQRRRQERHHHQPRLVRKPRRLDRVTEWKKHKLEHGQRRGADLRLRRRRRRQERHHHQQLRRTATGLAWFKQGPKDDKGEITWTQALDHAGQERAQRAGHQVQPAPRDRPRRHERRRPEGHRHRQALLRPRLARRRRSRSIRRCSTGSS